MRLIDADAVKRTLAGSRFKYIRNFLNKQPTIDAVPVVRCKDCRHRRHLQGATDEAYTCSLGWGLSGIVAEEDFCSYGKRKDGAEHE